MPRSGAAGRLRLAGLLIATGLLSALPTLFWTHPVSFFLFAGACGPLVVAGMLTYLWSGMGDREGPDAGRAQTARPRALPSSPER